MPDERAIAASMLDMDKVGIVALPRYGNNRDLGGLFVAYPLCTRPHYIWFAPQRAALAGLDAGRVQRRRTSSSGFVATDFPKDVAKLAPFSIEGAKKMRSVVVASQGSGA